MRWSWSKGMARQERVRENDQQMKDRYNVFTYESVYTDASTLEMLLRARSLLFKHVLFSEENDWT